MSPGSLASAQPLTALGGMGPAAAGMAPDAKASAPATWCGFPTADIISDPNSNNKLRFSGKNGSHLQLRDNSSAPTFLTTKTVATDSVNRIFNQDRLWRRPPSKLDMSKKWTAVSVEGPAWMKVPAVEARPESRPKHTHFWNV